MTEVFQRTAGRSDVVAKEMYTFADRGGDGVTLRPEGTAGVARAVISGGLQQAVPLKFFYQDRCFVTSARKRVASASFTRSAPR